MKKIYFVLLFVFIGGYTAMSQVLLPRDTWKIAVDCFQPGIGPEKAIDGDTTTIWHSNWDKDTYPLPHWIVVDFGKAYNIMGFSYRPRTNLGNGTFKNWEFSVSADSVTWTVLDGGTWTWEEYSVKEVMTDPTLGKNVRYMKLWTDDAVGGFGTCAEINAYVDFVGASFVAAPTNIYIGKTVQFTDKSDHNPTAWSWTFEGGDPATSTDQNPVVTYENVGTYDVTLTVTYADGQTSTITNSDYISVNKRIPSDGWELLYFDSEQVDPAVPLRPASNAIDGDPSTFWHTCWSNCDPNPPYPHWIAVDMGEDYNLESFIYYPRPGAGNGTVDSCDFYVIKEWPDREDTSFWKDPVNWGEPVVAGAEFNWSAYDGNGMEVPFKSTTVTGRYFVFYALSEKNNNPWANCGEIFVVGEPATPTFIKRDQLNADVNIYPNPNAGSFMIKLSEDNANIRIYNTAGMLVYQKNGASTTESVNVDGKGVYLINIEIDGKTTTRKLIIR
jgi:PKD repeat protein